MFLQRHQSCALCSPASLLPVPRLTSSNALSVAAHCDAQRRHYVTFQKTNDMSLPTIADVLGLKGTSELEQLQRSPQLVRAAFRRRAKMLRPDKVPGDKERMQILMNAYSFMQSDAKKLNYLTHNESSIDHKLGILREGHSAHGNYDPDHQSLDHLLMRGEAESGFEAAEALGTQRTFSDFTRVYKDTTGHDARGVGDGEELPTAAPPLPGEKLRPANGKDIAFLLKLSFEEGAYGCQREISYPRHKRCVMCRGSGRAGVVHTKCPQCHGRGSLKTRSGTYDSSEMCDFCMGHGKVPPRLCGTCKGNCTLPATETYVVNVPSASTNMTELWVQRMGHDGKRGGTAGNLVVTLMVGEHRVFHTSGLDLHAVLPIPLSIALLGGYVDVPRLDGSQQLRIEPLTTSGTIYTIHGQGITDHLAAAAAAAATAGEESGGEGGDGEGGATRTRGDLRFHIVVVVPHKDRLSGRQIASMEVLKALEAAELAEARRREEEEKAAATAFADASASSVDDDENVTTRPPDHSARSTPEDHNGLTQTQQSAQSSETKAQKRHEGALPKLRRPVIPKQPVNEPIVDDTSNDLRMHSSTFFMPKTEITEVHTPSEKEFIAMKEKFRSWLPNSGLKFD